MRMLFQAIVLAGFLAADLNCRAEESTYVDLSDNPQRVQSLKSDPIPISGYPTVLSMGVSIESGRLRAIDVNGNVRQWRVRAANDEGVVASREGVAANLESAPVCAALSADAKWLASADDDGVVSVTDLDHQETVFRDDGCTENTVALTLSKNGEQLGGVTANGTLRVWETRTGTVKVHSDVTPGPVQTLAFSDDGALLAAASFGRTVEIFDLAKSAKHHSILIDRSRVTALAFAPGGDQIVVATSDGTMCLVNVAQPHAQRVLANHPFAIWTLSFDESGRLAAGSWDGRIRLWNAATWELIQSVKAHQESICAISLGEQGMIAAGMDGKVLYWSPEIPSLKQRGVIRGSSHQVWVAAYSPNGNEMYIGGTGKRSELWDLESKKRGETGPLHPTVRCAAYSPDGSLLATGGDDGRVVIASARDGSTRQRLEGNHGPVSAVLFVEDGKTLISGCDRGLLKFWDVTSGKEITSRKRHQQQLYGAAVSPGEELLITGGGHWAKGDPGELIVWDLKNRRFKRSLRGHSLTVWSIVFAPDGRYFASSDSAGEVKIWNTKSLQLERTLKHKTWVRPLAMSPDGKTLAVGRGDGSIRLWDTTTWKQTSICNGHDNFTFWLSYSPDGETVASGGDDGTVRLWQTD